MSEELLQMVDLSKAELAPELGIEDEELGLLRCRECGLAWTAELFEDTKATGGSQPRLSCPGAPTTDGALRWCPWEG